MDHKEKYALIRQLAPVYRKAPKKERGQILNQIVLATNYHRFRASWLLTHPPRTKKKPQKRVKVSRYRRCFPALKKLWGFSNFACGKRLVGMLPSYIETLTRDGELAIAEEERQLLLALSAATIDRLLKIERKHVFGKGRTTTRPGTLLKHNIPIHVFTQWDERKPGFAEVDLVAHCGPTARGDFAYTLDFIDLCLCWNECRAFLGRGAYRAMQAMQTIKGRLPIPLLGLDSDNDDAFINWHLYHWCQKEQITFTRCREYHKNDQAHVEEKNWSVVRRYTGYKRYDTQEQVDLLNKLYDILRLYLNFFQATMKLERKERIGAKVKRIYGKAKTPYQRVLEHSDVPQEVKDKLTALYQTLNPAKLLREISKITDQLAAS